MKRNRKYKKSLIAGILILSFSVLLYAQEDLRHLCANPPNAVTYTCGPGVGSSCTKVVKQLDPVCGATCPGNALSCYCIFSDDASLTTMTYSGTVISLWQTTLGSHPKQNCPPGQCTFQFIIIPREGGPPAYHYTCLTCTTSGPGVPSTRPGKRCTDGLLFP